MAKKLLVKSPQTTDGTTIAYDSKKQPLYRETIVELTAKKQFESLNAAFDRAGNGHLKHEFETVDVDDNGNIVKPTAKKDADK